MIPRPGPRRQGYRGPSASSPSTRCRLRRRGGVEDRPRRTCPRCGPSSPRTPPADGQVCAVTCGHRMIVCPRTPMTNGARTSRCARTERLAGEKASSKGKQCWDCWASTTNSTTAPAGRTEIRDAVRPIGAPDEADVVTCLDAGHVLIDVMEAGHDVIDGQTHHVSLPVTFLEHVRSLNYRTPTITVARFAAHYDETRPTVGWASAVRSGRPRPRSCLNHGPCPAKPSSTRRHRPGTGPTPAWASDANRGKRSHQRSKSDLQSEH